jgi:CheY-like chemotaxis protein
MAHDNEKRAGATKSAIRVLVVEDNPHVVGMYEYALRKLGGEGFAVQVEHAANGHDALSRLAAEPALDLVMTDLYMPVLDGFTLLERMKAEGALRRIPVVVISAGASDARVRALELGADVYLQKPVQLPDVVAAVRTLLRLH